MSSSLTESPEQHKPGLSYRQQEEEEVKAMLGIAELPEQRLTAEEWEHYEARILGGDSEATEELLMRRLRVIYHTAKTAHVASGDNEIPVDDLFQLGIEGFYRGLRSHAKQPGKRSLSSDVVLGIYSMHGQALRARGLILNYEEQKQMDAYDRHQASAINALGVMASDEAIDDHITGETDLTIAQITEIKTMKQLAGQVAPLTREAAEAIPDPDEYPDETAIDIINAGQLKAALNELSARERPILLLRYGLGGEEPLTLDEIALLFDVNRGRIRQIEMAGLKTLQHMVPSAKKLNNNVIDEEIQRKRPILKSDLPRQRAVARRLGFRTMRLQAPPAGAAAVNPYDWSPEYYDLADLVRETVS
jgi:RNA polymerase sigma factor (sigma-70 family)